MKKYLKSYNRLTLLWMIMVILLIIPAVWALFMPGYFGASDDLHIAWLYELHKTLIQGQFPPRFVPDLSYGFGYPLFNFVFPLPFYLAEMFHLFGLNLVDSIKLLFFLTVPLSGLFMYLLLRRFTNKSLSLLGVILYIYAPYRSVDLYVRGAIGEILSFVFLPLIALSVIKLTEFGKVNYIRWIGIGALSIAAIILTHNITAYMFLPFIVLLWMARIFFNANKFKQLIGLFVTVIFGLLISCYFWLPALRDSNLVKYDTVFNFADHFPTIQQLFKPYWGYGASVPGPNDGMSFFLGTVNIAVLIIGILLAIFSWNKLSKDRKIILSWALACILSAIFLMNFRSSFLWSRLPLLPYFQFPWRFLILTTFSIPIFVIPLEKLKLGILTPVIFISLILITSGSYFRPQDFLGRLDEYFLNRYIPVPVASADYRATQEEYLRLPITTQYRPNKIYPLVQVDAGDIKKTVLLNDFHTFVEVNSTNGLNLSYNKYFFPGWVAKVDNSYNNIVPGSPFGQITVPVSAGLHSVEILYQETVFNKLLDAISLASFLVSLMVVNNLWIRLKKSTLFS